MVDTDVEEMFCGGLTVDGCGKSSGIGYGINGEGRDGS